MTFSENAITIFLTKFFEKDKIPMVNLRCLSAPVFWLFFGKMFQHEVTIGDYFILKYLS